MVMAPIEVRIVYARDGRVQVRQSRASCYLDDTGEVLAFR
jgi:hypothetical protein